MAQFKIRGIIAEDTFSNHAPRVAFLATPPVPLAPSLSVSPLTTVQLSNHKRTQTASNACWKAWLWVVHRFRYKKSGEPDDSGGVPDDSRKEKDSISSAVLYWGNNSDCSRFADLKGLEILNDTFRTWGEDRVKSHDHNHSRKNSLH